MCLKWKFKTSNKIWGCTRKTRFPAFNRKILSDHEFDTITLALSLQIHWQPTQLAITCSKLTIETLEQRCEICSKLTIKTLKRRHWRRFGVFIVNFEHISHLCSRVTIANFEQVNAGWAKIPIYFSLTILRYLKKCCENFCYLKETSPLIDFYMTGNNFINYETVQWREKIRS